MLKTKLDKLLFAVATLLCIIVAAVFVSDRLKQQAPVRDFERIPARSVSDEMIITPELEGRKDTPLDENNASDLPAVEIPAGETTVVTTRQIPADTQSYFGFKTNSNPAVAAWFICLKKL